MPVMKPGEPLVPLTAVAAAVAAFVIVWLGGEELPEPAKV